MRRGNANRRDRGERRYETNRQTEGDFGSEREVENSEGGRLAEFAQGDLNRGDEGEEVESLGGGSAECTSDPAEGLVLDNLEFLDQGTFGSVRPIPELAPICDDRDDAGAVQEAHVVGGQTADCVA